MSNRQPSAELLFGSEVLPELLQVLLNAPDKRFGWTDLNRSLAGANRDSLYRALGRAVELGVIKREPKGRYGIYSANTDSPLYRDLRRVLAKLETRRHNGTYAPESVADLARDLRQLKIQSQTKMPPEATARILQFVDDFRSRRRSTQRQLLARLEAVNDPRRERYLTLLTVINGWPAPESLTPVLDWSIQALSARVPR